MCTVKRILLSILWHQEEKLSERGERNLAFKKTGKGKLVLEDWEALALERMALAAAMREAEPIPREMQSAQSVQARSNHKPEKKFGVGGGSYER